MTLDALQGNKKKKKWNQTRTVCKIGDVSFHCFRKKNRHKSSLKVNLACDRRKCISNKQNIRLRAQSLLFGANDKSVFTQGMGDAVS